MPTPCRRPPQPSHPVGPRRRCGADASGVEAQKALISGSWRHVAPRRGHQRPPILRGWPIRPLHSSQAGILTDVILDVFSSTFFFEEQSHFFHEIPLQKIFSVDPHTVHDLDRQLRRCTKRPLRPLSPYASPLLAPCPFSPPIILSLSPLLLPLSSGFHRVDEGRLCRVRRPALCLVYPRRC